MFRRVPHRKGILLLWLGALTVGVRLGGKLLSLVDINNNNNNGGGQGQLSEVKLAGGQLKGEGIHYYDLIDNGGSSVQQSWGVKETDGVMVSHGGGRRLMALANCTPRAVEQFPADVFSQSQRMRGALAVHILLVAYMFLGLAVVCDDYFVPSLEVLCDMLHLQPDVAGATFMAAGSSAPELATAVIGVFIAKDDVGLGTVVGSAIYNIMFVVSVCGLAANMVIQLNWWPLVRDCGAYLVSVVALIVVIVDEKVVWYESVLFLVLYVLYCVFMAFNRRLETAVVPACYACCSTDVSDSTYEKIRLSNDAETELHSLVDSKYSNGGHDVMLEEATVDVTDRASTEEHKTESNFNLCRRPSGKWAGFLWWTSLPLKLLLCITMPDCRKERLRKWFWLTFSISLVWLSVFSFLMVWMITIIGYSVNVPDSIMALTFVAFGVSLPDVVASVIVVRDGLGDMAMSNAVGSNVFDILVCLGVPWFIKTCLLSPGSHIQVYSQGLVYSTCTLLSTVAILLLTIHLNKWKLDKRVSLFFMFVYIAFTVLASLYELNVFGYFHPEECPSHY